MSRFRAPRMPDARSRRRDEPSSSPDPATPGVTVVVPTFRREDDAVAQAARFAAMRVVTRVLVVDQGRTLAAGTTARSLEESPKVRLISQPNLGGSGGYARGMLESLASPDDAVYLSDDDAR